MTLPNTTWTTPSAHPVLSDDEVHVWRASLDQPTADYAALLSADEQAKAQRFRFEQERRRFIVGRGTLRIILGRYLNLPPEKLQFEYRAHGKPALTASSLCFNLSHSEDMALYAVTHDREVGIDLEHIRPVQDVGKLAEQFFSPAERAELDALPLDKKLDSFFSGWTSQGSVSQSPRRWDDLPLGSIFRFNGLRTARQIIGSKRRSRGIVTLVSLRVDACSRLYRRAGSGRGTGSPHHPP